MQAVRNEVVAADAAFLQREVERLTGELAEACSGAAETAALRAELAAASAAGSHLAEELAAAESAVRATQVPWLTTASPACQHALPLQHLYSDLHSVTLQTRQGSMPSRRSEHSRVP